MRRSDAVIIGLSLLLFSILFIGIPYWIYTIEGNRAVSADDLVEIKGHVASVRSTRTGGKNPKPIIYLELKEYPHVFRIANSAHRALDRSQVSKVLQRNAFVELKTQPNELDRSMSGAPTDKVLNWILKWRAQPLIYSLRVNNKDLLTLDSFNAQQQDFNFKNLKWGIVLVLFIAVKLGWAGYQDRKAKH